MPYKKLTTSLILIISIYFFIGIGTRILSQNQEPYPFFSWFLFSQAPDRQKVDYTILIHQAGDNSYSPPLPFEKIDNLYNKEYPTSYYNQKVRQMARTIESNEDSNDIQEIRDEIESQFLISPVKYEISKVTYDPLERWKTGELINSETINVFETQK